MKKLFIGLILVVLMTIPVVIYRHFDNKKIEGVQDVNSKIITRPEASEVIKQPSSSPTQQKQNNLAIPSNNSKRTYIQGEINKLEEAKKVYFDSIELENKAINTCPEGFFQQCYDRIKQTTDEDYQKINQINSQIQDWKMKLADTY